jgi:AcrR family transcriptional regulator
MTQPPTARDAVRTGDGKITRELMLATALEIIDRAGVDALSMRRLGAALDRDPMILYRHAPGKAALLDGVVETVLAQLRVDPADPDWTAQLRPRHPHHRASHHTVPGRRRPPAWLRRARRGRRPVQ